MAQCLRFVVSGDNNDEKAIKILKQAAKEAGDAEIDVGWVDFEDIERDPGKIGSEAVIVCETFQGEKFEALKNQRRRIAGPACVLHCLRNIEPLPGDIHPVLSLSMSDIVACCTNISIDERSKLKEQIVAMGGIMVGDFTQSVTHLIAGEVGSKKYKVACDIGIPIVQQSWVFECWTQSRYKVFQSRDEIVQKHLCPCFKGLTICVTGLDPEVRKEVAKLTMQNGGKYSGELNMRTCTHLIVKVAQGEKYAYARQWKIHCVSPEWFYCCLKEGHWLDESGYEIAPGEESKMDSSKILEFGRSIVDVTTQSYLDCSGMPSKAAQVARKSMKNREDSKNVEERLDNIDGVESKKHNIKVRTFDTSNLRLTDIQMKSNMLLDGCKIYLSGMPQDLVEQIRKLINTAGGMRFNMLNSNVTHIIIGDVVSTEIYQFLEDNIQKPFVVSPNWLLDSCRMGEVMGEEGYSLLEKDEDPVIMAKPSKTAPRKDTNGIENRNGSKNIPSFQFDDDLDDEVVFGQYLPQAESSRIFVAESRIPATKESEKEKVIDQLQTSCNAEAIAGPELEQSTASTTLNNKALHQCKYAVKFFEKETAEQVKSLIQEFNGKIVNQDARADYVIVPLTYEKKRRIGKKEVTICWLEQSIEAENLLDKHSCFLFRPFHLPPDCLPLKDFVMTVSQLSGTQREHVIQLGDLLGALMQDSFVRKATNDLHVNTHLLLAEACGAKYEAACKWGVACVTKEWLFACAENKKLMPVEEYPLLEEEKEHSLGNDGDEKEEESKGTECEKNGEGQEDIKTSALGNEPEVRTDKTAVLPVLKSSSHPANENPTETSNLLGGNFPANPQGVISDGLSPGAVDPDRVDVDGVHPDGVNPNGVNPPTTPSRKMKPLLQHGEAFRPSFDLGDMMEYLKSPATCFTPRTNSRASRSSFAFDEFVGKQLRKALEITSGNNSKESGTHDVIEQQNRDIVRTDTDTGASNGANIKEDPDRVKEDDKEHGKKKDGLNGILEGVVIAVSKKLSDYQTEIHNLASLLGADYRYIYEDSCTHLIHKGKATDNLTEVKQARTQGKFIVSRHWLDSCLESSGRVQEELFPSTYNPKMSLSVISKGRKSTRASAAMSSQPTKTGITNDSSGSEETQKSTRKSSAENATKSSAAISNTAKEVPDENTTDQKAIRVDIDGRLSKGRVSPPFVENTSSLDARLEFKRQMEVLMEATKGSKGGMLRNRRQLLNSASPNDDSGLKRSSVARRLRSRQSSQKSNSESSRSSGERKQNSRVASFPTLQPSQGDVITYDDPAGRQERERILAQLKAASPSQDGFQSPTKLSSDIPVDQIEALGPAQAAILTENANQDWVDTPSKSITTSSRGDLPYDIDHLSTPPHRPISMHIANPVQQPAPVNLLDENDPEENANIENKTYKFILSAMTPQEKIHYSAMIEELGGLICDSQYFTLECSHVIVGTPNRNEKYLASVAAGKWVLHKSYLEASREAGFFVAEESHEWGTEQEPTKLTLAVRRWRKKLSIERKVDPSAGAFKGWHVLLCVGSSVKQQGFKRMLEAGGGVVGSTHPPFKNLDGVTHAFIDSSKAKPGLVDYNGLYSAGIWVLRPEYIADYLMQEPPPPTLKYVITEVQKLIETEATHNRSSDTKKRKNEEDKSSQKMKRTKK